MRIKNSFFLNLFSRAASPAIKTLYRTKKSPAIPGLTITRVPSFDDRIDDLWQRVSSSHQIMVVRKKEYLNWRYSPPGVDYCRYLAEKDGEVWGYLVLRCAQQGDIKVG